MSVRAVLITCCGLASGLFAAVGVNQMQGRKEDPKYVGPPMTKVLVVKSKIERGYAIKENMVELKDWPQDIQPESSLQTTEVALGRIALTTMMPGEPVLEGKLAATGASRGAGNLIQHGMRAYSILTTSAASSVAGLVLPGDHVDVVLSLQSGTTDFTGGGTSTTLLQNVEILAINHSLEVPEDSTSDPKLTTVTLLVTQKQAALLGLGQKAGVLSLSLRNPEDEEVAETEPVTLAEVRFREELNATPNDGNPVATESEQDPLMALKPSLAMKPRLSTIKTLRGTQTGIVSVELGSMD